MRCLPPSLPRRWATDEAPTDDPAPLFREEDGAMLECGLFGRAGALVIPVCAGPGFCCVPRAEVPRSLAAVGAVADDPARSATSSGSDATCRNNPLARWMASA
mmetsp:Transcript_7115/g.12889  ORF Transcript_7115/g.12889 Transcript_7115/m.12889 type:complete len:103 (-) Transcript_7115:702-1010(-)